MSSLRTRLNMLFCPIRRWETVVKDCGECETHFELYPEAFRMLFCLYTVLFFVVAIIVTRLFAGTDMNDNPVINRFGWNSICVMMDDPPFSLFGSTLWFPAVILLLTFEVTDYIRVRSHCFDGDDRYPIRYT